MYWCPGRRGRTIISGMQERRTWSTLVSWESQDPRCTLHDLASFCWAQPPKGTDGPASLQNRVWGRLYAFLQESRAMLIPYFLYSKALVVGEWTALVRCRYLNAWMVVRAAFRAMKHHGGRHDLIANECLSHRKHGRGGRSQYASKAKVKWQDARKTKR